MLRIIGRGRNRRGHGSADFRHEDTRRGTHRARRRLRHRRVRQDIRGRLPGEVPSGLVASGSARRMPCTAFCEGAGEKPSMVSAATASSSSSLLAALMGCWPGALTAASMPSPTILSFSSTMIRCAVLPPIPLAAFSRRSSPREIASHNSAGVMPLRMTRALCPPTPLTDVSSRNSSRSAFVAKPHST